MLRQSRREQAYVSVTDEWKRILMTGDNEPNYPLNRGVVTCPASSNTWLYYIRRLFLRQRH